MKRRKIDLDFRPSTYWPAKTRKGQRVRELPPEERCPVAIACIILHSAIGDETCVKAGWSSRGRIWYRASDGYSDHVIEFSPTYSKRPLTLRALISSLDGLSAEVGGEFFDASPSGCSGGVSDGFVEVCSIQYPQLETWYDHRSQRHGDAADKVLTAEIARFRTRYRVGLDFSEFTTIDEAAVPILAGHQGTLCLDGLTELSDEAARVLSRHCGDLTLRGLWGLSDEAAKSLCRHRGGLYLNGLRSLFSAAAEVLATFEGHLAIDLDVIPRPVAAVLCTHPSFLEEGETLGDFCPETDDEDPTLLTSEVAEQVLAAPETVLPDKYLAIDDDAARMLAGYEGSLCLDRLKYLSDAAAESLSRHQYDLSLDGLTSISDAAAESLSKYQGDGLHINGLTSISDAAAESLSKYQGDGFQLNGLTSVSDAVAESLSKYKGCLSLDGLTSLSAAAEESLSKHEGGLYLDGLRSLSDALAATLGKNTMSLRFPNLTSLSDAAAESLSKCGGDLDLSGLTSLSDAAAESLSKHRSCLYLRGLKSLSHAAAKSLSKRDRYVGPKTGVGVWRQLVLPFSDN